MKCRLPKLVLIFWCVKIFKVSCLEFSKSGDHDILARRQGGLYGLKDGFNKVGGLGFLDVEVVVDSIYKMIFCEGHGSALLCIGGFLGDFSIVQ